MGASFNTMKAKGTQAEVRAIFEAAQEQDRHENGHCYSGGFGMATGLTFSHSNVVYTESGAEAFLVDNCEKWEDALAVRLTGDEYLIGAWCAC